MWSVLSPVVRNVELVDLTTFASQGNTTNTRSIQWGPCDPSLVANPLLSCGFFEVPLDYHDASVGKGRLAVIKANATGERRGTFFVNPGWSRVAPVNVRELTSTTGGPGVSGLEALDETSEILHAQVGGGYDIVSWDPRGVGLLTEYVAWQSVHLAWEIANKRVSP